MTTGSLPRAEPVPLVGSVPYEYHYLLDNMVARNEIGLASQEVSWPQSIIHGLMAGMHAKMQTSVSHIVK